MNEEQRYNLDVTDRINDWISKKGHGNTRDALNVALAVIDRLESELADLRTELADCYKEMR